MNWLIMSLSLNMLKWAMYSCNHKNCHFLVHLPMGWFQHAHLTGYQSLNYNEISTTVPMKNQQLPHLGFIHIRVQAAFAILLANRQMCSGGPVGVDLSAGTFTQIFPCFPAQTWGLPCNYKNWGPPKVVFRCPTPTRAVLYRLRDVAAGDCRWFVQFVASLGSLRASTKHLGATKFCVFFVNLDVNGTKSTKRSRTEM